jgi:hypothetical protein
MQYPNAVNCLEQEFEFAFDMANGYPGGFLRQIYVMTDYGGQRAYRLPLI